MTGDSWIIQVKGNIKDGVVTLQIQNDLGKVESATGKEVQDNQVLTNPNGSFKLFTRDARNTLKIPRNMTLTY